MSKIIFENLNKIEEGEPFDLVLFRGKGEPISSLICMIENYKRGDGLWSHVGMLINTDICKFKGGKKNRLYVLESTLSKLTDDIPDVQTGDSFFGVQIRDFREVVKKYNGNIAIAKLIYNPYHYLSNKIIRRTFQPILQSVIHLRYDYNCFSLLSAPFPIFRPIRDKFISRDKSLFCSELVAIIYKKMGILKDDVIADEVLPVDLCDKLKITKEIINIKKFD